MEAIYIGWAALAAFFFIVLAVFIRKESRALRRDESALDPMFRPVQKKRFR